MQPESQGDKHLLQRHESLTGIVVWDGIAGGIEVNDAILGGAEAAVSAVRASAPFEHLPEAFKGPNIDLRLTFLYNQPFSPQNP